MKAVFIPCCLLLSVLCLALDSVIILEERCHSEIAVSAAVKVTVSNWTALHEISTCTVNITTTRDREEPTTQLMFLLLDMHSPSSNCSEVRLDIVDSDGTSLTPKNGFCENSQNSKQFVSSKPKATISLKSNATSHDSSFLMLIVKFHMQPCDDSNEFECDNNRCVPSNLKCDGDNNCGDNSDETDGCLMSMTVIIIIVVSTVALAITMILISVAVYRRYTGRKVWWGDPRLLAGATSINQDTSYEQADTKKQVPCYGTIDQTST